MNEIEGSREVDDATLDEMLRAARAIMSRAYVPYSGFHVGAALLNEDGTIRLGVNVENASYPLSVCAERNAVASMVGSGQTKILAVAVATNAAHPTPPCGGCRQVLWEFGDADTPVVAEGADGIRARWRLGALLPDAFGPDDLR
jgi:cytidine deaminase